MKKFLLFLISFYFLNNVLVAQVQFEKVYPGTYNRSANDVRQTSDGGYIETGYAADSLGSLSVFVIKTDMNGDTTWEKTISGGFGQNGFCVNEIDSGNFIITGYKNYTSSSDCDVNLIKLNSSGNLIYQNPFGGAGCQWGQAIVMTSDGNFAIGGEEFYKRDANGGAIWNRGWQGFQIMGIEETADHGFILGGFNSSTLNLRKTDSAGFPIWSKSYPGTSFNPSCRVVQQTNDGGYILVGAVSGFHSIKLIKTDSIGDTTWTKQIGFWNYTYGGAVQQTTDGGYIITGEKYDGINDGVYLVKTDAIGDTMWTRSFEHANTWCWGESVQQTTDGGYIIGGSATDTITGITSFYLIKTDPALGIHSIDFTAPEISVYPNPFHESTTFYLNSNENLKDGVVKLFDVMGNEVRSIPLTGKETVIEKDNLSAGIYFYEVIDSKEIIATGKICVQ